MFDAKRLIGREWSDTSVQHDLKFFPFKLVEKSSKPHIRLETSAGMKEFSSEEVCTGFVYWKCFVSIQN